MRTEELPDAFGFDPDVIHGLAHNIISFLRANCTLEGHTYWLHKTPDDVRL